MPQPAETVVGASPAVVAGLDHWRTLPVVQQPVWPDPARAAEAAALAERVAAGPPSGAPPTGEGARVTVAVARRPGLVGAVARALDEAGIAVDDVVLRPTTLDEAYLRITGRTDERVEVPA